MFNLINVILSPIVSCIDCLYEQPYVQSFGSNSKIIPAIFWYVSKILLENILDFRNFFPPKWSHFVPNSNIFWILEYILDIIHLFFPRRNLTKYCVILIKLYFEVKFKHCEQFYQWKYEKIAPIFTFIYNNNSKHKK